MKSFNFSTPDMKYLSKRHIYWRLLSFRVTSFPWFIIAYLKIGHTKILSVYRPINKKKQFLSLVGQSMNKKPMKADKKILN